MDGLPQEILENIFSYLPQNELLQSINKVCVIWKQLVASSPKLWRNVDFSSRKDFPLFMRHFSVVQNLIRYFDLSEFSFKQLIEVDSSIIFTKLTTLCIELVSVAFCDEIVKRCPNLENIELKIYKPATPTFNISRCLQKLAVFELQSFKIECFCTLSDGYMFNNAIHKFIKKQTGLQKLSIGTRHSLDKATFIDIFTLCTNLKHIEIANDCITDNVFTSLKRKLNLHSISMIESTTLSDQGIKSLVELAKDLKNIDLFAIPNVTDKGLLLIAQNCHDLEKLSIGGTDEDNISDGLSHIATGCPRLKSLSCLSPFVSRDTQIISIANSCKSLESITIVDAFFLTDRTLFSLAENSLFLKHVEFSCAEFFTIYGVVSLILSCHFLKILRFDQCEGISEMDLEDKERKVSEVQNLKEKYLKRVSSKDENHSALEILDLSSCSKVSNNTILQLAPLCPELKSVHASCTLVTKDPGFEQQLRLFCKRLSKVESEFDFILQSLS